MTGVTRTNEPTSVPAGGSAGAGPSAEPLRGEFDAVARARAGRPGSRGDAAAGRPAEGKGSIDAAREDAAEAALRQPAARTGGGTATADRGPRGDRFERETGGGADAATAQALAGELTGKGAIRFEALAEAPALGSSTMGAAAHIQEIAQRIVESAELRTWSSGASEMRLELHLGDLGTLRVAVHRDEDGGMHVGFETTSARAAELIETRGAELVSALEGRGLPVEEMTVEGSDRASFRIESSAAADEAGRSGREPVRVASLPPDGARDDAGSGQDEGHQRRPRAEAETDEEDE